VILAPGVPEGWPYERWAALLPGHLVAVSAGFDAGWERAARRVAAGRPLLSIRLAGTEAHLGPRHATVASCWDPCTCQPRSRPSTVDSAGCAGCAQVRAPQVAAPPDAGLRAQVAIHLRVLGRVPLRDGELLIVTAAGQARRHRIRRSPHCQVCGDGGSVCGDAGSVCGDRPRGGAPVRGRPPGPVTLRPRPASGTLPTRGRPPFGLDPARMRRELVDSRYGPVTRLGRADRAPFAVSEAWLAQAPHPGLGRGRTYRGADAVAVLEAFERSASVPRGIEVVERASRRGLGGLAIDPATLGRYTREQLDRGGRLRPYTVDTELDWVWGHRLGDGNPVLVPAEIGFYRYEYPAGRRGCFVESSSGCALGGSYEEAALHALLELAERDAFAIGWHAAVPLPSIDPASIADPESAMLLDTIGGYGYDVHLLAATGGLDIPTVWALAVHHELAFPATFSAAGSDPEPAGAVRSALWELGQLVAGAGGLDVDRARELAADWWRIATIDDHIAVNTLPRRATRVTRVLGGPVRTPAQAFPGWPDRLIAYAAGDVTRALRYVAGRYARAGLGEIILVDQSSPDHRALGLHVVKAVVPGIVPMCFGQPYQRVAGLPRLSTVLSARAAHDNATTPLDPHPFP
jgi:ribosomal protein S12 methylthiotransferase accessory factor